MIHTLSVSDLTCGYGKKEILEHISFSVSSGECICILGPNGVGKTTLFRTMLGLLPTIRGSISFDSKNRETYSARDMAKLVAYVPQARETPFSFTAIEMVTLGRTSYMGLFSAPTKEDKKIAAESMERLGIYSLAKRYYTELSGGEQQMVLIARALAQQPSFLVLDEPTSSLDFGNQAYVLSCVNTLRENELAIVMTTHNPSHAFLCAASVLLVLPDGTVRIGSCEEVLTPENMKTAYNIETCIGTLQAKNGQEVVACSPVLP